MATSLLTSLIRAYVLVVSSAATRSSALPADDHKESVISGTLSLALPSISSYMCHDDTHVV